MPSIKKISESVELLKTYIDEYSSLVKYAPDNFSHKVALQSLESQISELQGQLYQENLKREKEIVELRFKGHSATFGTLPLLLVGGLSDSFSKAIFNTSKYFQFGKKSGKKINQVISENIDLRLEGIGKGSTIFYLSGKTSPDVFGTSIIQRSLENTFSLLNSESSQKIVENISLVGRQSIQYYSKFLNILSNDNLELELSWHTPNETVKVWNGTKEKILSLYHTLNDTKLSEPEEIYFEGEIITLSLKGIFEVVSKNQERFHGSFPNELTSKIKLLHVGDFCKGVLLKTTIVSQVTGKDKYEYLLQDIET